MDKKVWNSVKKIEIPTPDKVVIAEAIGKGGGQGPKGDPGDSAYITAVNNGFVGTEEQWIASLKGEHGIPAGFGDPISNTQSVANTEPAEVIINASGPDTAKVFNFTFKIPKGADGTPTDLSGYLPLTAGSDKSLTGVLYTNHIYPSVSGGTNLEIGGLSRPYGIVRSRNLMLNNKDVTANILALDSTGDGSSFLADDGTYKEVLGGYFTETFTDYGVIYTDIDLLEDTPKTINAVGVVNSLESSTYNRAFLSEITWDGSTFITPRNTHLNSNVSSGYAPYRVLKINNKLCILIASTSIQRAISCKVYDVTQGINKVVFIESNANIPANEMWSNFVGNQTIALVGSSYTTIESDAKYLPIPNGDGTKFLSDDNTYKEITATDSKRTEGYKLYFTTDTPTAENVKVLDRVPEDYVPTEGDVIAIKWNAGSGAGNSNFAFSINGIEYPIKFNNNNLSAVVHTITAGGTSTYIFNGEVFDLIGTQRLIDLDTTTVISIINTIPAGENINGYKVCMEGLDGNLYMVTKGSSIATTKTVATEEFKLDGSVQFRYSSVAISIGSITTNYVYVSEQSYMYRYAFNGIDHLTNHKKLYLKGTLGPNGGFILDNSTYTSWYTTEEPTEEDGFLYKLFGWRGSNNYITMIMEHPVFHYKNGAFRPYLDNNDIILQGIHTTIKAAVIDIVNNYNGESGIYVSSLSNGDNRIIICAKSVSTGKSVIAGMSILSYNPQIRYDFSYIVEDDIFTSWLYSNKLETTTGTNTSTSMTQKAITDTITNVYANFSNYWSKDDSDGRYLRQAYFPSQVISDVSAAVPTATDAKITVTVNEKNSDGGFTQTTIDRNIPPADPSHAGLMTADDKVKLNTVPTFKTLTQSAYDAIAVKDPNTFYFITG